MKINRAKPLPDYRLELEFDSGERGIVDLSNLTGHGVFAAWQQAGIFERVGATEDGAVEWPGGIDLCPDALYLRMAGKRPEDIFPTLDHRLSHA